MLLDTSASPQPAEHDAYDAWGKRRFTNGSDDPANTIASASSRGFTGQEHLADAVSLIHLNGRLYDPQIGRMISADPGFQSASTPFDTQAWNFYDYARNNPLRYTDPTGYDFIDDVGDFFSDIGSFFSGLGDAIGGVFNAGGPGVTGVTIGGVSYNAYNGKGTDISNTSLGKAAINAVINGQGTSLGTFSTAQIGGSDAASIVAFANSFSTPTQGSAATSFLTGPNQSSGGVAYSNDGTFCDASGCGQAVDVTGHNGMGGFNDIVASISARDQAYLNSYYWPVANLAPRYGVNPALVLGVGIESAFASRGTYSRTGDAFGMTGGSTSNMEYFNGPQANVNAWFSQWGPQIQDTGSNVGAFTNGLLGMDAQGNAVAGWKVYNTVNPNWDTFIGSGISEIQRDLRNYMPQPQPPGGL